MTELSVTHGEECKGTDLIQVHMISDMLCTDMIAQHDPAEWVRLIRTVGFWHAAWMTDELSPQWREGRTR